MEYPRTKTDLENRIPLHRITARGRKYVYVRGTNIALVKGFTGSPEALEEAITEGLHEYLTRDATHKNQLREDAALALHRRTLSRARTKGRTYLISAAMIGQMLGEAEDQCSVTGLRFDYNEKTGDDEWYSRPLSPSLDRINNKDGYELGNIRLVCNCVNIAIGKWGLENFEKVCRAFVERNGR